MSYTADRIEREYEQEVAKLRGEVERLASAHADKAELVIKLQDENERLRAVLKPFALAAEHVERDEPKSYCLANSSARHRLTIGHLINARAAPEGEAMSNQMSDIEYHESGQAHQDMYRELERLRAVMKAADELRKWWLNDGHEMREPSLSKFNTAKKNYDAARAALDTEEELNQRRSYARKRC